MALVAVLLKLHEYTPLAMEARLRVGTHSSELTRNWAKGRVWALVRRWALFHETTVHTLYMYADKTASKRERQTHNQPLPVVCMGEYQ